MFKLMLDEGEWSYLNNVRERIISYQVNGMPDGQRGFVHMKSGNVLDPRWQLRREKNGVDSGWSGNYETPEEALAVLQKQVG
jgi:hypothetical protein